MPARLGVHDDGELDLAAGRRRAFGDQLRLDGIDRAASCAAAGAGEAAMQEQEQQRSGAMGCAALAATVAAA